MIRATPDFHSLRQAFKEAVGGLPLYKRAAAFEYVGALEQRIDELAKYSKEAYNQGVKDGISRSLTRPGDGEMGG